MTRLTVSSLSVLAGLVWAVNLEHYGAAAAVAGLVLAAGGLVLAIRTFRAHTG